MMEFFDNFNTSSKLLNFKTITYFIIFFSMSISTFFYFYTEPIPNFLSWFSLILFSILIGHATLFHSSAFNNLYFPLRIVLSASVGLFVGFLWIFSSSIFLIDSLNYYSLIFFSCVILLLKLKFSYKNTSLLPNFQQFSIKSNSIQLTLLFSVILFYFILFSYYFNWWPSYGDVFGHSFYAQIQNFSGKLTLDFVSPLSPTTFNPNPMGVYTTLASLSDFYGLTIPETFFIIQTFTFSFLILSAGCITYYFSKSVSLVGIVLLSFFIVNTVDINGDRGIWGFYIVGLMPNLLAFFGIITALFILILKDSKYKIFGLLVLVTSLTQIYPPTIFYLIFIFLSYFLFSIFNKQNKEFIISKNRLNSTLILNFFLPLTILILFFITVVKGVPQQIFQNLLIRSDNIANDSLILSYYGTKLLTLEHFNDTFFSVSVILGLISSIVIIFYGNKEKFLGITFLIILFFIYDNEIFQFFDVFSFPVRFSVFLPYFSLIIISLTISLFISKLPLQNNLNYFRRLKFLMNKNLFVISFALLILFFIFQNFEVYTENIYPSQVNRILPHSFLPYLNSINWFIDNVPYDSLTVGFINPILETPEYGVPKHFDWIPALRVSEYFSPTFNVVLTPEIHQEVFSSLNDYNSIFTFMVIEKYDIEYLITDNHNSTIKNFQNLSYLTNIYSDDYANIYKINLKNFKISPHMDNELRELNFLKSKYEKYKNYSKWVDILQNKTTAFSLLYRFPDFSNLDDDNDIEHFMQENIFIERSTGSESKMNIMQKNYFLNTPHMSRVTFHPTYLFINNFSNFNPSFVYEKNQYVQNLVVLKEDTLENSFNNNIAKILSNIRTNPDIFDNYHELAYAFIDSDKNQLRTYYYDFELIKSVIKLGQEYYFDIDHWEDFQTIYNLVVEKHAESAILNDEMLYAIEMYDYLISENIHEPKFYMKKANVYEMMGFFDTASEVYEQIIEIEPTNHIAQEKINSLANPNDLR